ncbi:MAG: response regulator transcription factor, partial [Thioalkalivibrio sp.]
QVVCVGSAGDFLEAYQNSPTPGCLILDVRMPGMSGLELQTSLQERGWCLPIIIVTGHGDVPMAVRAMKGGAVDFLQKPYNDQLLLERIAHAMQICAERHRRLRDIEQLSNNYETLTPREREVAVLVVMGKVNKVIAAELNLSPRTVEVHRANVMSKMQAHSVPELVQMFIRLERILEHNRN